MQPGFGDVACAEWCHTKRFVGKFALDLNNNESDISDMRADVWELDCKIKVTLKGRRGAPTGNELAFDELAFLVGKTKTSAASG